MNRRAFLAASGLGLLGGCASRESDTNGTETTAATAEQTAVATDKSATVATDESTAAEAGGETPFRGVSLSPRSYSDDEFTEFFEHVRETDLAVRWAGNWQDLAADEGAPAVVCTLAEQYGYQPIIETGVYSVDAGELFQPLDEAGQAAFVETVSDFAAEWKPPYFGIGVEVNLHAEDEPEQFETFVSLFADTYDAIKDASPSTQVYTGFQLEWMRGLRGGVFGGENDASQAQWDLLDRFPKADLVAFTSYPDLVFERPADIPDEYYVEAADRVEKPIAITETGWAATPRDIGWERTEAQQVAFVERLSNLTKPVDVAMLVWLWMYDQGGDTAAFDDMTLRRPDGSARPVWDAWTTVV
ncbi:hypothetical protein C453_16453 [Haloferax elongans ATCC BAA-1513]|uniref:Uncharacterized protein n=1 Tax=Haloferax elongans ATCC BAA-1513 TaxID=1230453 RepID=M0HHX6_HALEO|nr:hypothetical protein [Haloferax elongans]ELZ82694.1 hypothetical protein C453_16453 [Haloferax elongans ATCC BAA-1513]